MEMKRYVWDYIDDGYFDDESEAGETSDTLEDR